MPVPRYAVVVYLAIPPLFVVAACYTQMTELYLSDPVALAAESCYIAYSTLFLIARFPALEYCYGY